MVACICRSPLAAGLQAASFIFVSCIFFFDFWIFFFGFGFFFSILDFFDNQNDSHCCVAVVRDFGLGAGLSGFCGTGFEFRVVVSAVHVFVVLLIGRIISNCYRGEQTGRAQNEGV